MVNRIHLSLRVTLVLAIGILGLYKTEKVFARDSRQSDELLFRSTTILVLDNSDSMNEEDASTDTKLEAAGRAGYRILDVLDAENQALEGSAGQIGIVSFNSTAQVELGLTTNMEAARSTLSRMSADGATAMPDGLEEGINLLKGLDADIQVLILLTDGMPNVGLGSNHSLSDVEVQNQVLDLAAQAGDLGICIYTIGLGDPLVQNFDEQFLRSVSSNAGCGAYYRAEDATQLANIYVKLRHESTGKVLLERSGEIQQNEEVPLGDVEVPLNQEQMMFTLNWPGSELFPVLTDPNNRRLDSSYPGISISTTESLASVIVKNPIPGIWKVSIQGIDVPYGVTTYNAILSVRERIDAVAVIPQPVSFGGGGIAVVLTIVVAFIVFIFVLGQKNKRTLRRSPIGTKARGRLHVLGGASADSSINIVEGMLVGRGSACHLRLMDRKVSRQHAQFRLIGGKWYVYDLGSMSGTSVNGRPVQQSVLKAGDIIRVGDTTIEFR